MIVKRLFAAFLATTSIVMSAEVKKIDAHEAARLVAAGQAVLVDVREPDEWADTGVAAPAVLLPMSDLNGDKKLWTPFLKENEGKTLLLYCRSGNRSGKVASALAAEGKTVANAGAFKDWAEAGLPVRKVEAK